MDRLRAAALDAAQRGRAGIEAVRQADADRGGRAEALARQAAAHVAARGETARARRERALGWAGATPAGAAVGQGVRRFGQLAQRVPLLTAPMDLLQERNSVEVLLGRVREDPRDVLAQAWLGEALLAMQVDARRFELARTVVSPQGALFRESMKAAAKLGTAPAADPATQVLNGCATLAAHRLRSNARDGAALHALARVRLATGNPADALQPAKLAVAATPAAERGAPLVTLARVFFALGHDESAANIARKAVDAGCSLGWGLLAELLYRDATSPEPRTPRHREYVALRARVRDDDRRAYHGVHRTAAEISKAVLDAQLGRVRALGAQVRRRRTADAPAVALGAPDQRRINYGTRAPDRSGPAARDPTATGHHDGSRAPRSQQIVRAI